MILKPIWFSVLMITTALSSLLCFAAESEKASFIFKKFPEGVSYLSSKEPQAQLIGKIDNYRGLLQLSNESDPQLKTSFHYIFEAELGDLTLKQCSTVVDRVFGNKKKRTLQSSAPQLFQSATKSKDDQKNQRSFCVVEISDPDKTAKIPERTLVVLKESKELHAFEFLFSSQRLENQQAKIINFFSSIKK